MSIGPWSAMNLQMKINMFIDTDYGPHIQCFSPLPGVRNENNLCLNPAHFEMEQQTQIIYLK